MKTKLFSLFFALVASVGTMFSSDTQVDGIWYDFDDTSNTASVTYRGGSYSSYSNEYSGSVVIPSVVSYDDKTYSVTSIGKTAFYECSSLTSITIPNSVTSISTYAFTGCTGLTSIEIPNSVTSIGYWAFGMCTSLTAIEIPNSVTSISASTFNGCTGLTSIEIPNSITSIGAGAFYNCTGLTSILIPNGVTCIGERAFYNCTGLTSIPFPNSVTSIGDRAFEGCSNLASITIPNSVTEYGHDVFRGCVSLPIIDNIRYADTYLVEAVDKTLSTYTIQQNTTWIGDSAFSLCKNLNSIEIPDNVKGIGRAPFYFCNKLPVVNNVRYADTYAIEGIANQTTYIIKEGTKWIGESAFRNNSGVNNHSNLVSVDIPNGVKNIGEYAFRACKNLASIIMPNSVTSIEQGAFLWCTGLTSVTLSDSLACIGHSAFDGCRALTSITIPNSVNIIEGWAFNATGLTSVEIPNSVKIIEECAFYQCYYLDSVVIGENVKSIGSEAFAICWSLRSFVVKPTTPPSLGNNVFTDSGSNYSIYVPCGTVDTYKNAIGWKSYASKIMNIPSPFHVNTISENGTISVPQYSICNESIEIIANPNKGYHFVQWSDGNTDNPRTITLTQDTTFTAQFAINQYTISVSCNPQQGSIAGDSGTFNHGTKLTYKATPNEGYHFTQWSDGIKINPRTIVLTQDTTIKALFAINTYLVKFFGFNNVLLDSQSIEHGAAAVAPEAPTIDHFDFVGWDKEFTNVTSNLDIYAIYQKNTEDVENASMDFQPYKVIIDGQIFILHGETVYTLQGQEVR